MLEDLHRQLHRPVGLYGVDDEGAPPRGTRQAADELLTREETSLARLRLVMDAWVGLWFWTLDDDNPDPPSWTDWLTAVEALTGPESSEPTGQLDMFDDMAALADAELRRAAGRTPVADVLADHAWLGRARELARREAAWHWELDFAPLFQR